MLASGSSHEKAKTLALRNHLGEAEQMLRDGVELGLGGKAALLVAAVLLVHIDEQQLIAFRHPRLAGLCRVFAAAARIPQGRMHHAEVLAEGHPGTEVPLEREVDRPAGGARGVDARLGLHGPWGLAFLPVHKVQENADILRGELRCARHNRLQLMAGRQHPLHFRHQGLDELVSLLPRLLRVALPADVVHLWGLAEHGGVPVGLER
mmetsp:Transcript_34725/g.88853  ORF Transcript_34725/g.88853 Transcript_34725/m.88853 type:complete len:207 (-) Transcript_34725:311-931(-)